MSDVRHALTIDVEDWYHVENLRGPVPPDRWDSMESRLERNMEILLELLDRHRVKATFFVLGRAVEHRPGIVEAIVRGGHELACHGWSHDLVYRQTPERFAEETRRAKELLEAQGGVDVLGYRASTFSIVERSLWALDLLAKAGFAYDSSIAPLRHDRYGIPTAPAEPHVVELAGGASILEVPVCTMRVLSRRFPLGGGFFRLFPLSCTTRALREYEARGQGGMIYLHPWEIDPGQPRVKGLKATNRLRHYARLGSTLPKLERLLAEHAWEPLRARLAAPVA